MSVRDRMKTCLTTRNIFKACMHFFAIGFLNVLLIDYLSPSSTLAMWLCTTLFWMLIVIDYQSQEIDMRFLALFFLLGIGLKEGNPLFSLYLGLCSFFFLHILQEATARVKPSQSIPGFHFESSYPELDEQHAPPYLPYFLAGLIPILLINTFRIPLPPEILRVLYLPIPYQGIPTVFWLLPLLLLAISLAFYRRNRRAMRHGKDIVYRGFGDGDAYFLGAAIGVFGFFVTLSAAFLSLLFAYFGLQKRLRNIRQSAKASEKEN